MSYNEFWSDYALWEYSNDWFIFCMHSQRLIQELDNREAQFVAVVDKGEALVMDRHPASKTIEVIMSYRHVYNT